MAAADGLDREESPLVFVRKRKRSVDLNGSPSPPLESELALPNSSITEDAAGDPPLLENDRVHLQASKKASSLVVPGSAAQRSRPKRSKVEDRSDDDDFFETFALPPSAMESTSSASVPAASCEDCPEPVTEGDRETALVPLDDNPISEDLSQREQGDSSPRKKPMSFAKPVEIRVVGSGCSWERLPTLKRAHEVSGLGNDVIKTLCESGGEHLGWECRWPPPESESDPAAASVSEPSASEPCDVGDLAQRISKIPSAARRRLVAALPASTRGALAEHLKTSPLLTPQVRPPPKEPELNDIITGLPEVLRVVPQDVRCKVLAGVRGMGARLQAMLVAPDIATIADLIKEATPAHRKPLMEALPQETQKALMEHMLQRNAAGTKTAGREGV